MSETIAPVTNDNLVLILGDSASGKSASLRDLRNPERVFYANCEAGKKLPFKSKFKEKVITDPYQVYSIFDGLETEAQKDKYDTVVIDTFNFLMDMFESIHVIPSPNGQKAWGDYGQFPKNLLQQKVARSTKNILFLAHAPGVLNEELGIMEYMCPMKGAMKGKVEAFFSTTVFARVVPLKELEGYSNRLLTITEEDEILGYKNVFQTRKTKKTVGMRIRHPMGMWERNETFIDNNAQYLLDRLHQYYNEG